MNYWYTIPEPSLGRGFFCIVKSCVIWKRGKTARIASRWFCRGRARWVKPMPCWNLAARITITLRISTLKPRPGWRRRLPRISALIIWFPCFHILPGRRLCAKERWLCWMRCSYASARWPAWSIFARMRRSIISLWRAACWAWLWTAKPSPSPWARWISCTCILSRSLSSLKRWANARWWNCFRPRTGRW